MPPQLDAPALGGALEAVVIATMRAADHDTVQAFDAAIQAVPHSIQAQRPFGDPEYLPRVIAADLPAFLCHKEPVSRIHIDGSKTAP